MVKGLKGKTYEVIFFSFKRRLRGDLIAIYNFLKGSTRGNADLVSDDQR